MNGSRFRAALLLGLVFVAGAAAGIAGDRLEMIPRAARAEPAAGTSEGETAEERDQPVIERFADDLGLTAEQRGRIEALLDRFRHSTRELSLSVRPQYRALMDSVKIEIEGVLDSVQIERYRELLADRYGRGASDRGGPADSNGGRETGGGDR
jgi:Spy/CpxP family protein refolding chaperone